MIFIGILDFLGVRGCLLRNSRIPSPRLAQFFIAGSAFFAAQSLGGAF